MNAGRGRLPIGEWRHFSGGLGLSPRIVRAGVEEGSSGSQGPVPWRSSGVCAPLPARDCREERPSPPSERSTGEVPQARSHEQDNR